MGDKRIKVIVIVGEKIRIVKLLDSSNSKNYFFRVRSQEKYSWKQIKMEQKNKLCYPNQGKWNGIKKRMLKDEVLRN